MATNRIFRLPVWSAIIAVVGCGTDKSAEEQPVAPDSSPVLALTPTEYNNTVRDLLSMPMDGDDWSPPFSVGSAAEKAWPWNFPEEVGINGFEGIASGQISSPYQTEQLYNAANHFAQYVKVSSSFYACSDFNSLTTSAQQTCGWNSIKRFTQRAWRRPIAPDELQRLEAFFGSNWNTSSPDDAIALTVSGILLAPQFLYRIEQGDTDQTIGDAIPLTSWEMASRLSYFLWDSMPDATLFGAAAQDKLQTKQQVSEQVQRMLQDPKARTSIVHFHNQWLGTNKIQHVSPARRAYGPTYYNISAEPALDTSDDFVWPTILLDVRKSMELETNLFIEKTIFDGAGTFTALMTDNHGYLSNETAPLYGDEVTVLAADAISYSDDLGISLTLKQVEFPANQRSGVLTLPSVLALLSHPVHPAPVLRGKFIFNKMACQPLGAPPPGAEEQAPPDTLDADSTNRERTEAVTSPTNCAVCHDQINPPGFAFENYDAMGGWRTEDNGHPVDASGSFQFSGGEQFTFQNAVELASQLAASNQVRDCYSLLWAQYATGTELSINHPAVAAIQEEFRQNDDIKNLLLTIATSDLFRYRRGE